MENQTDLDQMEKAKRIQRMIRVLPNEAGVFCLEDLEEIYGEKI